MLVLDHYEVFRLMDTWLRQVLVPALPDSARLLLASREQPVAAWFAVAGFPQRPHGADERRGRRRAAAKIRRRRK